MEEEYSGFQLSQTLDVFGGCVRTLAALDNYLLAGSYDLTCRLYEFDPNTKVYKKIATMCHSKKYVNATHITKFKDAYWFCFAGQEKRICICNNEGGLLKSIENAHENIISSLSSNEKYLVSGGWDAKAQVWSKETFELVKTLEGHMDHAVCVCFLSNGDVVTGSQRKEISFWDGNDFSNKKNISLAHDDVIRQIIEVKLEKLSVMTCSNDETAKLWSYSDGLQAIYQGHSSYVFDMSVNKKQGKLYTASDDRNFNVYNFLNTEMEQAVLHPDTLWGIQQSPVGDVITGCVDGKLRVFTTDKERYASQQEIQAFQKEALSAGANTNAQMGKLDSKALKQFPSIDKLNSFKGKKQGVVQVFRISNEEADAYSWHEEAGGFWERLGAVVTKDKPKQGPKKYFAGNKMFPEGQYEYIYDIELKGQHLKLPFNDGESHLRSAEKFCAFYKIGKDNIGQILNHIKMNSKNVPFKPKSIMSQNEEQASDFFPNSRVVLFEKKNMKGLEKALLANNQKLVDRNDPTAIPSKYLMYLKSAIRKLSDPKNRFNETLDKPEIINLTQSLMEWPNDVLIPVIDLNRVHFLHYQSEQLFTGIDKGMSFLGKFLKILTQDGHENLKMVTLRALCNSFQQTATSRSFIEISDLLLSQLSASGLEQSKKSSTQKALASLLYNVSCKAKDFKMTENSQMKYVVYLNTCLSVMKCPISQFKLLQSTGNMLIQFPALKNQLKKTAQIVQALEFDKNAKNIKNLENCKKDLMKFLN